MLPPDLLSAASDLAGVGSGKPRQAHLRRAVSTTYYALFHTLARNAADLLVGGANSGRSKPAWHQTYRALDHGFAKSQCQNLGVMQRFPPAIQDFANMFVQMQEKRHKADYDPNERVYKSAVLGEIKAVKSTIDEFNKAPVKDRRAFAVWVLLRSRN